MGELSGEEAAKWTGKPERPNERVASESIENDEARMTKEGRMLK
jgi:hypothetical protein